MVSISPLRKFEISKFAINVKSIDNVKSMIPVKVALAVGKKF